MEITAKQVCGNTWCLRLPKSVVPYYHLDKKEIILLDSGSMLNGELEQWLDEQGLRVRAILNTHDHWDHVAANRALRAAHGAKIYLPKLEAALHATDLGYLVEHGPGNYEKIRAFYRDFDYEVDEEIGLEDGPLSVCGAAFTVIHTPGHSVDHVSFITPDRVLYVGDTLMTEDVMRHAKVSYVVSHEVDIESKKKLLQYHDCAAYIMAHGGVEDSIDALVEENIRYVHCRADAIWRMIRRPMSMEEIIRQAWKQFDLRSGAYYKNVEMGNMIRVLVQYLVSDGRLECRFYDGADYYAHSKQQEESTWN